MRQSRLSKYLLKWRARWLMLLLQTETTSLTTRGRSHTLVTDVDAENVLRHEESSLVIPNKALVNFANPPVKYIALLMNLSIREAVHARAKLEISYNWGKRIVEPHAYGVNQKDSEIVRVYQTSGASRSGKPTGWKILPVDEILGLVILSKHFDNPRQGYKRGDKALSKLIYCEL